MLRGVFECRQVVFWGTGTKRLGTPGIDYYSRKSPDVCMHEPCRIAGTWPSIWQEEGGPRFFQIWKFFATCCACALLGALGACSSRIFLKLCNLVLLVHIWIKFCFKIRSENQNIIFLYKTLCIIIGYTRLLWCIYIYILEHFWETCCN